jgi:urease accessory protein
MLSSSLGVRVGVVVALALQPGAAAAHLVSTQFGELYSDLLHPLTSLLHLVPWLALGLLAGFQGRETARWVLLLFPVAVLVGALLAGSLPALGLVSYVNVASFVVLGGLVALGGKLASPLFVLLTLIAGLSHGYANGAAELAGRQQLLYVLGVTIAAYVLIALVTAASWVMAHRPTQWTQVVLRALGSWITAVGIVFGGFVLTAVRRTAPRSRGVRRSGSRSPSSSGAPGPH